MYHCFLYLSTFFLTSCTLQSFIPCPRVVAGTLPLLQPYPLRNPVRMLFQDPKVLLLICLEWADVNDTKVNKTKVNLERTVAS